MVCRVVWLPCGIVVVGEMEGGMVMVTNITMTKCLLLLLFWFIIIEFFKFINIIIPLMKT